MELADHRDPLAVSAGRTGAPGALWSAATASEIVSVVAEDVEAGLISPDDAMDLIDRVRARADPDRLPVSGPP